MSDGPEETAEELYEEAPCGYLTMRPDGTIVRVNGTFLRWTGHAREALVGVRRFQDLLTGGGRIYHETHYAPLLRMQGKVREIALDIVRADGSRMPALVNATLKLDADGEPALVRTTVFDATDRQRYERELLAARDRERVARERADRLQHATAEIAAAPDREAIALALLAQLTAVFGEGRAGVAVQDPDTGDVAVVAATGAPLPGDLEPITGPAYDEGVPGVRGALARVPFPQGGSVWIGFDDPREIGADQRAVMETCAVQAGLALERRRLYERSRDVAHVLQRSLLTTAPPADPRLEIATVYRPAVEHLEVGGDWYDAFALPGGRLGITVGDVVGRGLGAASAMGQLRSAVRALAGADLAPAQVLSHLDTFVEQAVDARYATLIYAEVDPATGEGRCASAGHMPAILLRAGGAPPESFMAGRSTPLGVPDVTTRPEARFALGPGDGFVFYTDGLVERRGESIDDGIARLVAALGRLPGAPPAALARTLPEALLDADAVRDDVCLLAFRRRA
ncbi:MAG: SpoIIE family protein phosphatase [Solirubrobacteraceae bacterium]